MSGLSLPESLLAAQLLKSVMTFEPDRMEYLAILSSMGVELPSETVLVEEILSKRIERVLDASQRISSYFPDSRLNVSRLFEWPQTETVASSIHHFQRKTDRAELSHESEEFVKNNDDPFQHLRQAMISMASMWDKGHAAIVYQDRDVGNFDKGFENI